MKQKFKKLNIEFFNFLLNEINQNKDFSISKLSSKEISKLTELGIFISGKLKGHVTADNLDKYHSRGAIDFFNDYIELYNNNKGWTSDLKFNLTFEKEVAKWAKDWQKTLTEFTSSFYIAPGIKQEEDLEKLKALYKDHKVFPDFCYELSLATEQYSKLNKMEDAQGIGAFGMDLFKKCPDIYHALGVSFAWFNDADITYDLFRMAQDFTAPEYSRVDHFIKISEQFQTWGKIKEAISMIDRATKLDKKQPKLFSRIGDLYLEINQKSRAKRYYNKALKIDPEFKYAKMKVNLLKDIN